jgi:hypothetical protein
MTTLRPRGPSVISGSGASSGTGPALASEPVATPRASTPPPDAATPPAGFVVSPLLCHTADGRYISALEPTTIRTTFSPEALALPPRTHVAMPDAPITFGVAPRAVAGVLLGVTGVGVVAPVAHAAEVTASVQPVTPREVDTVRAHAARLEERRANLTPEALDALRAQLYRDYVRAGANLAPGATRGERVMNELVVELSSRMLTTPRNLANPGSYTPIEGRPDLRQIPDAELQRLVLRALQDIPIGELPGGDVLAAQLVSLPGLQGRDVTAMSYREIARAAGDGAKAILDARFGAFFDKYKIEAAVVAFAGVTAARAASPDAARVLNGVIPRIKLWSGSIWTGVDANASLRYREARVLPDLDATFAASRRVGEVDLRATATATVPLERPGDLTGAIGVGARVADPIGYVDLSASVNDRRIGEVRLSGGTILEDSNTVVGGAVSGTFGPGVARGDASGRVNAEVSLDRRIDGGANGNGTFGAFVGVGADTDGRNPDARAGLMFRWRW